MIVNQKNPDLYYFSFAHIGIIYCISDKLKSPLGSQRINIGRVGSNHLMEEGTHLLDEGTHLSAGMVLVEDVWKLDMSC
jgi:hypothetical protein